MSKEEQGKYEMLCVCLKREGFLSILPLEDDEGQGFYLPINADICLNIESKEVTIGYIVAYVISGRVASLLDVDIDEAMDEVSQEIYDASSVSSCYTKDCGTNTLFIDTLFIEEPYRGKGVGTNVLQCLARQEGYGCGIVLLRNVPLERVDGKIETVKEEKKIERLKKYYESMGFKPLPVDDGKGYMVADIRSILFHATNAE